MTGLAARLRWRHTWTVPVAAIITTPLTLAAGRYLVRTWDLNPLTTQGVAMPVAVGVLGGAVLMALAVLTGRDVVVGITAGAYGGWLGTVVLAMLHGTPFGYGSMRGDAGRLTAMVTHFATTWQNTDATDSSVPGEYPPLYPLLLGRVAAWTGRPGWQLVGTSQAVLVAVAVLTAFLLWRRVLPDVPALLAASTVTVALAEPSKGNEMISLGIMLPWMLATFTPPEGTRRLNPVLAGVIVGALVPWYPSMLMVSVLGVAAVMVHGWWRAERSLSYVRDAAVTIVVGLVIASWYIVPLALAYRNGTQVVADLYKSPGLSATPFGILTVTPVWFYALQTVGLVGIAVLARRSWWAAPFGLLLAGVLALRVIMLLRFTETGHALLLFYVAYVIRYLLLVAGILVLVAIWNRLWPLAVARLQSPPRLVGAVLVAITLATFGSFNWSLWVPRPLAPLDVAGGGSKGIENARNHATLPHAERLPSGKAPRYATPKVDPWFPSPRVASAITATRGEDTRPMVLSYDQRLFSYYPWGNFLPPGRTSSSALIRWDDRKELLRSLADVADAGSFAARSADTRFGPIDAFVLQQRQGLWYFNDIAFSPAQFDPASFTVTTGLPGGTVVAARVPLS
jgi:hypothetical protein